MKKRYYVFCYDEFHNGAWEFNHVAITNLEPDEIEWYVNNYAKDDAFNVIINNNLIEEVYMKKRFQNATMQDTLMYLVMHDEDAFFDLQQEIEDEIHKHARIEIYELNEDICGEMSDDEVYDLALKAKRNVMVDMFCKGEELSKWNNQFKSDTQ
jgi:hypothetical protein